ncbi:MPPV-203 hypothetical protein [Magpiepox virus 2]|nr:MPPV-203 hypothetical protein [Magpiepox virus 2]
MDLNNTNQVIDYKEYIYNITNFITIKYNLYNVIVKIRNKSRAKKTAFNP